MAYKNLVGLLALLALAPLSQALCTYQEYVCGSELLDDPDYEEADLEAAYAINPNAPEIEDFSNVLFRCIDFSGGLVGNSLCIVDCAQIGTYPATSAADNDMCIM